MASEQNEPKKGFFERSSDWVRAHPRAMAITVVLLLLLLVGFFIPVDPPHVAIAGEPIFSNGPQWLTNSMIGTIFVDLVLLILAFVATRKMTVIPHGIQNLGELLIEGLYGLSESVAGKNVTRFFPLVATIFLFVIIANWSGMIPGVGSIGIYQYHDEDHASEEIHAEEGEGNEAVPADEEHNGAEDDSQGYRFDGQLAMANGDLILGATCCRGAGSGPGGRRRAAFCTVLSCTQRRPQLHLCAGNHHHVYGAILWRPIARL